MRLAPFDNFQELNKAIESGEITNPSDIEVISVKRDGNVDLYAVTTNENDFIEEHSRSIHDIGFEDHMHFDHISGSFQTLVFIDGTDYEYTLEKTIKQLLDIINEDIGFTSGKI
jgi:hypothetical protein